ncbi:hypothetical protein QPL51_05395 [Escherichia coli]|uniref:hypothetical protein n=1 Tax=Escherichia coli TaxID=562 RepID=UPI00287B362A|nr:hypothetical protein [Escherichia coli]MDS1552476.1 hypothetical protein [Escherichia coli]
MYNLIIIREPYESDNSSTDGEVLVFQSPDHDGIVHEFKDYVRKHIYMYRSDPHEQYGDIMFIVTHNGVVIEHVNMTNNMYFHNFTDTSNALVNDVNAVFNEMRKNFLKNDKFCTDIRLEEANTKKKLSRKYESDRKKEQEIQRLHELMKKYPNEVQHGS